MESKLIAEISDRVPSDKLDKDLIMFQSINGGAVVQENSVVNVVVSGCEQTQPVPDVRGLIRENAEQKLWNLGFAVLFEEA